MISLYPFQHRIATACVSLLRQRKRVMMQLPTGGGKTIIASDVIKQLGLTTLFLAHRSMLLDQAIETMAATGFKSLEVGRLLPKSQGKGFPFWAKFIFTTIQTLNAKGRADELKKFFGCPQLIIIDEAHHVAAKSYLAILDLFPDAAVLGMTATPQRVDGRGFEKLFDKLIVGPSPRVLIDGGFLSPYRMLTNDIFEGVRAGFSSLGGDFRPDELDAATTDSRIGKIRSAITKYADGRKGILFMPSIRSSLAITHHCAKAGVKIGHVDGKMKTEKQKAVFDLFRSGDILFLSSVGLIDEGFDVPDCDCIVDASPTKSLNRFLQRAGRALRYQEGKTALMLDLAGNHHEFAIGGRSVCVKRPWSLNGMAKEKKAPKKEDDLLILDEQFDQQLSLEMEIADEVANLVDTEMMREGILKNCRESVDYRRLMLMTLAKQANPHRALQRFAIALGYRPGWVFFECQSLGVVIPQTKYRRR